LVERGGIVPERSVPGVRHDVNLRVRQPSTVLRYRLLPDDRIERAVRDQDRLRDRRQQVVVVDDAREQRLTYERRHRHAEAQHRVQIR